jgi:predicted dehydrogenase
MKQPQFSIVILGAGKVSAWYDSPDSEVILSHAHAIKMNPALNLLGFYDIDLNRAVESAKKWGVQAFDYIPTADIFVICTPDEVHRKSVQQIVDLSPKLIVLEKPVAREISDVKKIVELTKGIPVQVNFSRRFLPAFQKLSKELSECGSYQTGSGLYSKGFIHNGSHMIDLLRLFVGEIASIKVINEINDYYDDDTTKTAIINFTNGGVFFMQGVGCRLYSVFEMDLCFQQTRVQITESGDIIKMYKPEPSKKYAGYEMLSIKSETHTKRDMAMVHLYENVYAHLTCGTALLSPLKGAIEKGMYDT